MPEGKMKIIVFVGLACMVMGMSFIFMNRMIVKRIELGILFSLVWIFQVIHNVRERSRKLPNIVYMVGTSASTMFYSIYQCCYPYNFFEYEPNIIGVVVITVLHALSVRSLSDSYIGRPKQN
jgi:hypothetical protein